VTPQAMSDVAIWVTCPSELVHMLSAYGAGPAAIAVITEW
jgi:hypothetical protein